MNMFAPNANEYVYGRTLFSAQLEQILVFLNYWENPNLTDYFGTSLLHFAVTDITDNVGMVKKLIEAGAEVNARNNCKQTPLHLAVIRYNWKTVELLLAHDADVNIKEYKGNTALHFAIDLLRNKKRHGEQEIRSGIVKKLLQCGADPNIANNSGETPLLLAVKFGDLSIVKDLLASGADVHYRNPYSETCLHVHSRSAEPDVAILKELVKYGACVNCCDDIGRTALEILLESDKIGNGTQLVETLIKIATLVNWKHGMIFQPNQSLDKTQSFDELIEKCYKEVFRMKSYIYSDGSTLCHFAIGDKNCAENDESLSVFYQVLDTLIQDDFPIYRDLIEAHFSRRFLEENLFEVNVFARNGKGKVSLHIFAVSYIIRYLSNRDLVNLIKAYSKFSRSQ